MRLVLDEGTRTTLMAAFVGAVVAMLVSPLAQTLSFLVNEYLARPLLSIEYVEVVPDQQQVSLPSQELQALLDSEGYRNSLMRGVGSVSGLMAFQGRTGAISLNELASLKAATDGFAQAAERRLTELDSFRSVLSGQPTASQIREIVARYQGGIPQLYAVGQEARSMQGALLATIAAETTSLRRSADLAKAVLASLSAVTGSAIHGAKFKLSILNRGGTDGLIRHVGELSVAGTDIRVSMRRTAPPESTSAAVGLMMAVPVAVTNAPSDVDRATSVGKVEAHSMSEFWFEIDPATPEASRGRVWQLLGQTTVVQAEVVLVDQRGKKIAHRFALAGARK